MSSLVIILDFFFKLRYLFGFRLLWFSKALDFILSFS